MYRSTWVDPRSWFLGLIPLLLKVGAMHGTHYETTNPSLVCTNPTSSGQTAGSNLAVLLVSVLRALWRGGHLQRRARGKLDNQDAHGGSDDVTRSAASLRFVLRSRISMFRSRRVS